jgi:hypothetical protein
MPALSNELRVHRLRIRYRYMAPALHAAPYPCPVSPADPALRGRRPMPRRGPPSKVRAERAA